MLPHLRRLEDKDAEAATGFLAQVGQKTAALLEGMVFNRPEMVKTVARKLSDWPVNLALEKSTLKDSRGMLRFVMARKMLQQIELGSAQNAVTGTKREKGSESPYRIAATQILELLKAFRKHRHHFFPEHEPVNPSAETDSKLKVTRGSSGDWVFRLFELGEPITGQNVEDWWKVAKVFLDERWELDITTFDPLIDHSRHRDQLTPPRNKPGVVKNSIINQNLKGAFVRLAITPTM